MKRSKNGTKLEIIAVEQNKYTMPEIFDFRVQQWKIFEIGVGCDFTSAVGTSAQLIKFANNVLVGF